VAEGDGAAEDVRLSQIDAERLAVRGEW